MSSLPLNLPEYTPDTVWDYSIETTGYFFQLRQKFTEGSTVASSFQGPAISSRLPLSRVFAARVLLASRSRNSVVVSVPALSFSRRV